MRATDAPYRFPAVLLAADAFGWYRSVFVRCTKLKRTHQSAQNMLKGLGLNDGVDLYVR